MLMPFIRRLAGGTRTLARPFAAALVRWRRRRTAVALSYWNDRLLRDVGLTRADYLACLSSPWDSPDAFGHVHLASHRPPVLRPVSETDRLAA